jgi:hypothetical protein
VAACDDDPTDPSVAALAGDFTITPDTIGVQEPIRVVFSRPIDPATALDPANFVVTDLCDTLRVPGSVRLSGDTLIFSPSQALEFLTLLSIRVQNVLDVDGNALPQPITFQRITQAPPVSDVSWAFMNSPTNDIISGVNFADQSIGYVLTLGGSVYRTVNGGLSFGARFKNPNITQTFNIQTFGGDTVTFLGAVLVGGSPQWAVFRSVDSALTFTPSNTVGRVLYGSQLRNIGGEIVGVVGGQSSTPGLYRYNAGSNTLTASGGAPTSGSVLFTDAALSPDTVSAVATFLNSSTNLGLAYRSLDGGASYTQIILPAGVPSLLGAGFIDNGAALLLGDSSSVLRVDVTTGQVTELGAANGIPQTEIAGSTTSVFSFSRARFVPGGQIGWITGTVTRRQPGSPDVVQGLILQTRNSGQDWVRQAIESAPENGLAFPPVNALQALSPDFAALSGVNGLIAARTDDSAPAAAACSFSQ